MSKYNPNTWWEKVAYMWREFLASVCVAVSLCAGCCNVRCHAKGNVPCCYAGTVLCAEIMASYPVLILPGIIDLPLEVVADTVTLPYDLWGTDNGQ